MSYAIGKATLALDAAISKLDTTDELREAFADHLASTCERGVRQAFLTWKANEMRKCEDEEKRKKAEAKDSVKEPEGPNCTCRKNAGTCELHGAGPFQKRLAAESATMEG